MVVVVSATVAASGWKFGCNSVGTVQLIAFVTSVLSLLWAVFAFAVQRLGSHAASDAPPDRVDAVPTPVCVARFAALLFAVVPAVIESVIVVMRMVYVGVDLTYGSATYTVPWYGFGEEGVWSLCALFLSSVVSYVATRDRRLFTCSVWVIFILILWTVMLKPTFRFTLTGTLERSGTTALLAFGLAFASLSAVVLSGRIGYRQRWAAAARAPQQLATPRPDWPGMGQTVLCVSVFLLMLFTWHLAVPVAMWPGAYRVTTLVLVIAGIMAASAALTQTARTWNAPVADAAIALLSLTLCATVLTLIPESPALLAERYPQLFGGLIIGFAAASVLCGWLADVWRQQLDDGVAWTPAGRLIPHMRRFVFLNVALGVLVGALMAGWPRLRGIATLDDTLPSMLAGMSAMLLLLLASLRAARYARRASYYILTMLAGSVLAGYVVIRMIPFGPEFG